LINLRSVPSLILLDFSAQVNSNIEPKLSSVGPK
jgi:hypothetical protein